MRISGGSARGRTIAIRKETLRGGELRPTSAKVRKAVFDILAPHINGALFLDLYAGSGAVGMEALSRGAERVVFVDAGASRVAAVRRHLSRLGFAENGEVEKADAPAFLQRTTLTFDIIFADPPYNSTDVDAILTLIGASPCLRGGGRLVVEHPARRPLPDHAGDLRKLRSYRYGDTALTLYLKETT